MTASAPWGQRDYPTTAVMPDGSIVLMGSSVTSDVWISKDKGATWTEKTNNAPWGPRWDARAVVMSDNTIILLGGETAAASNYVNDAWMSTDTGATWTRVNSSCGWSPWGDHLAFVTPNGEIFMVIGNAVWVSTDEGATWNLRSVGIQYPSGSITTPAVMNDYSLIVTGGYDNGYKNDVWRSTDSGVTWTLMNANAGWMKRYAHNSLGLPDGSVVVLGGFVGWNNKNPPYMNDVWRSTDNGITWEEMVPPIHTDFKANYVFGYVPMTVQFTDTSTDSPNSWLWDFGDGGTSTEQNPTHTFSTVGTYTISLKATNAKGSDTMVKSGYIVVNDVPVQTVHANFEADPVGGAAPLTVHFTDKSTADKSSITSWCWNFGDQYEGCDSEEQNPEYTYQNPGSYTVTLMARDAFETSDWMTRESYITVTDQLLPLQVQGVSVIPKHIQLDNPYTISVDVFNPNSQTVTKRIRTTETILKEGYDDVTYWYPSPDGVWYTIQPSSQISYEFKYNHHQHPFKPLESAVAQNGNWAMINAGMKSVWQILMGNLKVVTPPLSGENVHSATQQWAAEAGCRFETIYRYTFHTDDDVIIHNPYDNSDVNLDGQYKDVTVMAPLYKRLALGNAIYTNMMGTIPTIIAVTGPSDIIDLPFIDVLELGKINPAVALLIAEEFAHNLISESMIKTALDPNPNYMEPVVVPNYHIAELDQVPDSPLKEFVLVYDRAVPHALASTDAYIKYAGARDANDTYWQTRLLKETYKYHSLYGDDLEDLKVKSIPAIAYLKLHGLNVTLEKIQAARQDIQDNGLPPYEVVLFERYGYSDNDIENVRQTVVQTPDSFVMNYSEVIPDGFDEMIIFNNLMMSNLSDELGDEAPPYADFTTSTATGKTPLTIQFTDTSHRSPDQWSWEFGDGATAATQNAEHTYTTAGIYTINLTVTNSTTGSDTRTKYEFITVIAPTPPVANFTAAPLSGKVPLTIQFNDTSFNTPSNWIWNFGDGTNSTEQNPVHTYVVAGNMTVALNVTNDDGSANLTMNDYITVLALNPPIPNFTAIPQFGKVPLMVQFNDTSSGGVPTLRFWTFGDGTNSTEQNPVHIYTTPGNFTVALELANSDADVFENRTDYITVLPLVLPVANFTASPTNGTAPLVVTFSDASKNAVTAWSWDFGDGTTSPEQSPSHIYTSAGSYTVILNVTNTDGNASLVKPALITVNAPPTTVPTTIPTTQPTTKPTTRPTRQPLSPMTTIIGVAVMGLAYSMRKKW